YYVFWYNESKRRTDRLSLRTRDVEEAKRKFAAFLTTGLDGGGPKPVAHKYTVGAALDAYVKEHLQLKPELEYTRRGTFRCLHKHFGSVPVVDVDIPMCRQYKKRRMSGELSGRKTA